MSHPFQKSSCFYFNRICFFFFISAIFLVSCSKDDPDKPNPTSPEMEGLTIFKNQTGDPNADALQAHYEDDDHLINIYGTFNSSSEPAVPKTVTFQKKNNDTIVNFIFDPYTSRISSSFISVRGEKLPIVMKFSYPAVGSDVMAISLHDYDWASQTGNMFFRTMVNGETGADQNSTSSRQYSERKNLSVNIGSTSNKYLDAVVGAIVVVAAGKAIISAIAAVPAITAAAVATIGVAGTVAVAAGIVALTLSALSSDANASELIPTDEPYPNGVLVPNPVPTEEDPSPHLEESNCESGGLGFSAFMGKDGTIAVGNISGGVSPYSYYVNGAAQVNPFFSNDYPDGTYMISVKDAKGCISSRFVRLMRADNNSDNGINLNDKFYALDYVYIDYNYGNIEDPDGDYPYVHYAHAVIISPEPIDFNSFIYPKHYLSFFFVTDEQVTSLPGGEYECNPVGFEIGRDAYVPDVTFHEGEAEIYLGSIFEEIEPNHYDWKRRGYINVSWDGNDSSFNFHLYNENEEFVNGFVQAEMIPIDLSE